MHFQRTVQNLTPLNTVYLCLHVCIGVYACAAKIEYRKKVRRLNNHNFSMFFNVRFVLSRDAVNHFHISASFTPQIDIARLRIPQHCSSANVFFFLCYLKFDEI